MSAGDADAQTIASPNDQRMPTAGEVESVLRQHVLDVWFPRSLDLQCGGFLCDFDRSWRSCGPHEKLLEFQARQTWLAAEATQAYPEDEGLRRAALHGFRYLSSSMWDAQSGGWFHRVDRNGRPLEAHTKHAHGAAYAIAACVAVHEATGEVGALDLARKGFEWLERFAHDDRYGGYFGFLQRDGTIIREQPETRAGATTDTINTPYGLKDLNVHSDLLETFAYLCRVWPDPRVKRRLVEIGDILCEKMFTPYGLHFFAQADWTPIPHLARFGYEFQTAYRLSMARDLLENAERVMTVVVGLVDHALEHAWDPHSGGFFYAAAGSAPLQIEGKSSVVRRKSWWVQAEALKALLCVSRLEPENANYLRHFGAQWNYLLRRFIDRRYGGMYSVRLDVLPCWPRSLWPSFTPRAFMRKGSIWKDASHDGRAFLHCISTLRGSTPI